MAAQGWLSTRAAQRRVSRGRCARRQSWGAFKQIPISNCPASALRSVKTTLADARARSALQTSTRLLLRVRFSRTEATTQDRRQASLKFAILLVYRAQIDRIAPAACFIDLMTHDLHTGHHFHGVCNAHASLSVCVAAFPATCGRSKDLLHRAR